MNRIIIKKILHEGLMLSYRQNPTYKNVYEQLDQFFAEYKINTLHGDFYGDPETPKMVEIQYGDWDIGYEQMLEVKIYWDEKTPNIISVDVGFWEIDENSDLGEFYDVVLEEMEINRTDEISNDLIKYMNSFIIPKVYKEIENNPMFN